MIGELWNRVEAAEHRWDSQLARAIEVGLPVELSHEQDVALMREYLAHEFVEHGMIADFSIRRSDPRNPHAHVLLTLRPVTALGFGPKARHWNRKSNLLEWRIAWAERANRYLAHAGHDVRIDHRTLEAQQIELAPARRIGLGRPPPPPPDIAVPLASSGSPSGSGSRSKTARSSSRTRPRRFALSPCSAPRSLGKSLRSSSSRAPGVQRSSRR